MADPQPSSLCMRCHGPTSALPGAKLLILCSSCTSGNVLPKRTIKRVRRKTWTGWLDWLRRD